MRRSFSTWSTIASSLWTLKRDYILQSSLLTQMCVRKGVRKSERFRMERWIPGVNIVTPRRLGSNSFALYVQTTEYKCGHSYVRNKRGPRTEPDLVSLAFRDRIVVLSFLRCSFIVDRDRRGACEKTDILWARSRDACVKYRGREQRRKKFSVESISARFQRRSDLFPLSFFFLIYERDAVRFSIFTDTPGRERGEILIPYKLY